MLAKHKVLVGSFERAREFLVANPPPNPSAAYTAQRQAFDESIARLNSLLADQVAGLKESRDDTRRIRNMRRALRERHLAPVSQLAKALLAVDPAVREALAMPDTKLSTIRLIADATAFRSSAAKHESAFVEAGRPADFLARIDAAIATLRATLLARGTSVGRHVGARAGLIQELTRARSLIMMLDVLVKDAFAGNAEILARWNLAKRVQALPSGGGLRATGGTADENLPKPEAA